MKWKFNGKYIFFNSLTTTDSIALPDKSWFYCEIRFFLIYAFFGLNFILQKFCPCKRNDKYQVCSRSVFNCKNHLVINDLTLLLILGQFRNLLVSWTIFTIILFALKWLLSHSPTLPVASGSKMSIFLRYTHITPLFWGQTDPTQWDLKSPISWGNSG